LVKNLGEEVEEEVVEEAGGGKRTIEFSSTRSFRI
jgi:hypothetical protein